MAKAGWRGGQIFDDDDVVAYGQWVVRRRWLVASLSIIIAILLASGGRFLTFSTDYRVFFSEENPQLTAFETLQNVYSKDDNLLVAIKPREGNLFTAETLAAVAAFTEAAWQTPFSTRVDSLTNYQHSEADGDDLIVADLFDADAELDAEALARIKAIALAEPLILDRLTNRDGDTTGVNITLMFPQANMTEVPAVMAHIRALVAEFAAAHPELQFVISGNTALSNAFAELSQSDMKSLVPLMYGALLLVMICFLRSVAGTIGAVVVIGLSAAAAMGFGGWVGVVLTPPSVTAPTIILTVAVADSIHILSTMLKEMRLGRGRHEAIVEALRINMHPVFLTSLTTAIGFASLNFSDAPPFRDLGNLTAYGIIAAWLLSVTLLPALMALLPGGARVRETKGPDMLERGMASLAELVIARRKPLLWGTSAVIVALVTMIPRIDLNDAFVDYFDRGVPFRDNTDFIMENLTGIYQLHYSLSAGEAGAIAEPAYLERVDAFADWFTEQPGALHVNSITDIMRRLNRNMHGDDPAYNTLPDDRQLAAQYLLLYELSLPYGLDLNNQINVDKSATRVVVTTENLTTRESRVLMARAEVWLDRNFPTAREAEATGPVVMFSYLSERNINSMILGTIVAILLISTSLILALRDLRHGLVSLVPNTVPALMAFGLWGILVGEIGVAASVLGAASLGIIVDDTVHFLSKYLRARREQGLSAEDAVRYAFATVGVALTVTSFVLVGGFSVLALSSFLPNEVMGLMMAIAIACALLADFLLLPPLLIAMDAGKRSAVNASTRSEP
jgi:predicted RND superfamily exporter protein